MSFSLFTCCLVLTDNKVLQIPNSLNLFLTSGLKLNCMSALLFNNITLKCQKKKSILLIYQSHITECLKFMLEIQNKFCPFGWGLKKHQLHLCKGV